MSNSLSVDEKNEYTENRKLLLKKVRQYIKTELNPSKKTFTASQGTEEIKSIDEILEFLEISRFDYEQALSISDNQDFQIHCRRPSNSCCVNNYFCDGLMASEANMNIRPVSNHYKAIAYICAYLSKSKDECFLARTQAVRDAFERELYNQEQMRFVVNTYLNKRECSIQECVYHFLPGQWLRRAFPGVIFANSDVPEKIFCIFLSENEIMDLSEDSKDIFKQNMMDWYKT